VEENKLSNTKLDEEIYNGQRFPMKRATLIIIALFFFAFLVNFPLKSIIKTQIANSISMLRRCPIAYKDIEISLFFPKITLIKPVISGICFKRPGKSLILKDLPLSLAIPSISPPGLRLYTKIEKDQSRFEIYPTLSYATHKIRIKNSKLDTALFADFNNGVHILKGVLDINAYAIIRKNKLSEGDLLITSQSLDLPAQDFGLFRLAKALNLGTLQLKAKLNKTGTINVIDSFIGGANSPFAVKLSGKIIFNQNNPQDSKLELKGGIKFSKEFLEDYAILSLILNLDGKQANPEGFFDLRIDGKLNSPKPKVL